MGETVESKSIERSSRFAPNPDIKLVLNGSSDILDSATIPVEWHFSDALIANNPQYVVICDHSYSLEEFRKTEYTDSGERHLFKVRELIGYIQIHKAGHHHLALLVFCGDREAALVSAMNYVKRDRNWDYAYTLSYDEIAKGLIGSDCMTSAVEFEVPEAVFAPKPRSAFGQLIWDWVNRWYSGTPIDECRYRKRKIAAFTIQPIFFLVGRLLTGVFGTLYTLLGSGVLFFFGWRPVPMWKNVFHAWWDLGSFEKDLRRYWTYRLWEDDDDSKDRKKHWMPVWSVPFVVILELALAGLVLLVLYTILVSIGIQTLITVGIIVVLGVTAGWATTKWVGWCNVPERQEERRERREKREEVRTAERGRLAEIERKMAIAFLASNVSLATAPKKVDVAAVLPKVDTATRFRLSFWATKAKVCRPFAR